MHQHHDGLCTTAPHAFWYMPPSPDVGHLLAFALLLRAPQVAHARAAMAETAALAGPYVETVVNVVTNFRKNLEDG